MADIKRRLSQLTNAGPGSVPPGTGPRRPGPPPGQLASSLVPSAEPAGVESALLDPEPDSPPEPTRQESKSTSSSPDQEDQAARLARLRRLIEQVSSRTQRRQAAKPPPPAQRLPGETRETPFGPVHVAEERFSSDHCQGQVPVAPALEVAGATLAELALDPSLAKVDGPGMLFMDTETTGLAGGTGTVPFLVGVARFVDQTLLVEQFFLREMGGETPLLMLLAERLERATLLVTYNGKTFDWPLLRTRFIMNRIRPPQLPPHLDLLHCARRIFKRRLPDMRLGTLEEQVLGFHRVGDVAGAEIPARYWAYLRSRREAPLVPVLEHNVHDLVSLAAIVGRMAQHYEDVHRADEAEDHLAYARVAERAGNASRSRAFALAATEGRGHDGLAAEAWMFLANQARRRGDVREQERALLQAESLAEGKQVAAVHLALAKLCEHRLRDLERARRHAVGARGAEPEEQHRRRLERLSRRPADCDEPTERAAGGGAGQA